MDNIFVIWAVLRNSSCDFCKLAFAIVSNPYFSLPLGPRDPRNVITQTRENNSINSSFLFFFSFFGKFRLPFSVQKVLIAEQFALINIKLFLLKWWNPKYIYNIVYCILYIATSHTISKRSSWYSTSMEGKGTIMNTYQ